MKKILAIILCFTMIFSMAACSQNVDKNDKDDVLENVDNETAQEDYEDFANDDWNSNDDWFKDDCFDDMGYNENLDFLNKVDDEDFAQFQGKIDDIIGFGSSMYIYSDGVFYEECIGVGFTAGYLQWEIGKNKEIVRFNKYHDVLVVKNSDNTLTMFVRNDVDQENFTQKIRSMDMPITEDQFKFVYSGFDGTKYVCVYKENDTLMQQVYDFEANEIGEPAKLQGRLKNGSYVDLVDFWNETNENKKSTKSIDNVWYVVDNVLGNENGKAYIYLDDLKRVDDVDCYIGTTTERIVSKINDKDHLWLIELDDSMANNTLYKSSAVQLPDGYTTNQIVYCVHSSVDLIIKFEDGVYYELNFGDFKDAAHGEEGAEPFELLEELNEIVQDEGFVSFVSAGIRTYVLMNDGYLYEF